MIPSQDMTSLDMQIQSVRFITKPTTTWVGNLKIIEEFLSSPLSGVVLGDSTKRGRRSFSPSARLELLLGRVRRQLGRHRRGKPSVRSLDSKPKGTLHQPQGDDGSAERPLRVQLSSQRQDDRSLL